MDAEDQLIVQLKDSKTRNKAFSTLLDQYQERLYWFVRKIVITHDNANDVLQNTFIRVFKGIDSFEGKSALSTWLYRIAQNESLRFLEQNQKVTFSSLDEPKNKFEILSHDNYFDGDETKLKLHRIVEELTEKQRQVFQMKYFDDLSFKQISEILDISESTLKSSYYTAVKIIEEKIISP